MHTQTAHLLFELAPELVQEAIRKILKELFYTFRDSVVNGGENLF